MVKDQRISLPHSLGWFTVLGEPEDGRVVWYSIRFWNIRYSVSSSGSPIICGAAAIRKQNLLLSIRSRRTGWEFNIRRTVWEFTDRYVNLHSGIGDYQSDLASVALKHGVVLDKHFFTEVCNGAETAIGDLRSEISDAYNPRPRLARTA